MSLVFRRSQWRYRARNTETFNVKVTMKPLQFEDKAFKKPTKTQVIDQIANAILADKLDSQFNVEITKER